MPDPFVELRCAPHVVANIKMWNSFAANGSLPAFLRVQGQVHPIDLLSVGFTKVEINVLFGEVQVDSLPVLELIANVAAARVAICEAERGILAKRLPGGWKTSLESYSTIISAINSQPVLATGAPLCSYVLGFAGLNSLPGLVQAVAHVTATQWHALLAAVQAVEHTRQPQDS